MKFSLRHQSTGWLYPYMVPTGHLMYRAFFRKIHVNNRHGVPADRPVLLAANHPTAFIDPCLLCTYLDPPIYNMTRGDIFRRPFFRMLMESINMFPVYRMRDGYADRDRNAEVFEYCVDKLFQRRVVTIYVEGEHHLEKRVRPVQKGLARIAWAAMDRHGLDDLIVVPAGCNYMFGDRPRDEVMINIGAPLYLRDYREEYRINPAATTLRLCADIQAALKTVCYHLDKPEDGPLAEKLLTLHRSRYPQSPFLQVHYDDARFQGEKSVLDRLNRMEPEEKAVLEEKVSAYFQALERAGLADGPLANLPWASWEWMLYFIPLLPLFVIGYVTSFPVGWTARAVARRTVRKREFYSSVILGVGHLTGMTYYFLLFLLSLFTLRPFWIGAALLLPVLGWFAQFYKELWKRWRDAQKAAKHPDRAALLAMREQVEKAAKALILMGNG